MHAAMGFSRSWVTQRCVQCVQHARFDFFRLVSVSFIDSRQIFTAWDSYFNLILYYIYYSSIITLSIVAYCLPYPEAY